MSFNSSTNSDVVKTGINGVVVPGRKRRTLLQKMKRFKKGSGKRFGLFKKTFRVKYTNKLKGSYGETDLDKGTIKINRKHHKTHPLHKKRYPELLDTKVHEFEHVKHPEMTEKEVRKRTRIKIKKMGKKQRSKVYKQKTIKQ